MDVLKILNSIEEQDPEIFERIDTRRTAISAFAGWGKKLPSLLCLSFSALY